MNDEPRFWWVKVGVIVLCVIVFASILAHFDTRDYNRRHAWLDSHDCKRTAYHGDSLRGIWACPDGQVYMLRDVPL